MATPAIEASDGPSGLRVLQSDARIDLLITDVGLPGGINGRQLADAARTTRPDLKVLFITGYAENAIIGNGQLAPGMRVLTKPFVMDDAGGAYRRDDRRRSKRLGRRPAAILAIPERGVRSPGDGLRSAPRTSASAAPSARAR